MKARVRLTVVRASVRQAIAEPPADQNAWSSGSQRDSHVPVDLGAVGACEDIGTSRKDAAWDCVGANHRSRLSGGELTPINCLHRGT
jgi:hypothetical protein